MKRIIVLGVTMLSFAAIAQDNIIRDGDFENGYENWKGSKGIVVQQNFGLKKATKDESNHVLKITPGSTREYIISRKIKVNPGVKSLLVSFKARNNSDFKLNKSRSAFKMRIKSQKNWHSYNFSNFEWASYSRCIPCVNDTNKIKEYKLEIETQKAYGSFYIDDLIIKEYSVLEIDRDTVVTEWRRQIPEFKEMNQKLFKNLSEKEKGIFSNWSTSEINLKTGRLRIINDGNISILTSLWYPAPRGIWGEYKKNITPGTNEIVSFPKDGKIWIGGNWGLQLGERGLVMRISDVCEYKKQEWIFNVDKYADSVADDEELKNLIKNGDFSRGKSSWKSKLKLKQIKDHDNKYLEITVPKTRELLKLEQKISLSKKTVALKISAKVKSDTVKAMALTLYTSKTRRGWCLKKITPKWATVEWNYKNLSDSRLEFKIWFEKGIGKVYIDDVKILQVEE